MVGSVRISITPTQFTRNLGTTQEVGEKKKSRQKKEYFRTALLYLFSVEFFFLCAIFHPRKLSQTQTNEILSNSA